MESRQVLCVRKDKDGDIIALGGEWGEVDRDTAIRDIESDPNPEPGLYYVEGVDDRPLPIVVVPGHKPPYLRTMPDGATDNNLDNLPAC